MCNRKKIELKIYLVGFTREETKSIWKFLIKNYSKTFFWDDSNQSTKATTNFSFCISTGATKNSLPSLSFYVLKCTSDTFFNLAATLDLLLSQFSSYSSFSKIAYSNFYLMWQKCNFIPKSKFPEKCFRKKIVLNFLYNCCLVIFEFFPAVLPGFRRVFNPFFLLVFYILFLAALATL